MLIIKGPIELKSSTFHLRDDGGFAERIRGDHMLTGSDVNAQTLTHLLHTPPEVLISDAQGDTISNRTDIYAFREEHQTIINNVVNRILLSTSYGLTYQDRVYITDVLHKLGIRDDRRFMDQVRMFLQETAESNNLTNLYLSHVEDLRGMLGVMIEQGEVREPRESEEQAAAAAPDENRLYLSVMKRLKTGAIYQLLNNLNRSLSGDTLNYTEVQNSEQTYTARQLLLSTFREIATGEAQPLVYRAENIYEEETREETEVTDERIREHINSAVLMEVIRSFDHAISARNDQNVIQWMNLANSFYQSADNALTRILLEAREHRSAVRYERTQIEILSETERQERIMLSELFHEAEAPDNEILPGPGRDIFTERLERFAELTESSVTEQRTAERETEYLTESEFSVAELIYLERELEDRLTEEEESSELLERLRSEIERRVGRTVYERRLTERQTFGFETLSDRELLEEATDRLERLTEETLTEGGESFETLRELRNEVDRRISETVTERQLTDRLRSERESSREREFTGGETTYLERQSEETVTEGGETLETLELIRDEIDRRISDTVTERQQIVRQGGERAVFRDREFREGEITHLEREPASSSEEVVRERERTEAGEIRRERETGTELTERTETTETSESIRSEVDRRISETVGDRITDRQRTEKERIREREFTQGETTHLERESTETLAEEVERVNQQNVDNIERYREIRRLLTERNERLSMSKSDRERTIRESLKVLADRDHLKEIIESNETETSETNNVMERVYDLLPSDSAAIFRQLIEREGGVPQGEGGAQMPELMEKEFTRFIEESAAETEEEEGSLLVYRDDDESYFRRSAVDVSRVTEILREIVTEGPAGAILKDYSRLVSSRIREQEKMFSEREHIIRMGTTPAETEVLRLHLAGSMGAKSPVGEIRLDHRGGDAIVSFVHRREIRLTEEDVRETLEEYRRNNEQKKTVIEEEPIRINEYVRPAPQMIVNQPQREMSMTNERDIAEMVERGIRRQMNTIAGEVYTRLEKRLKTEKTRRGI